MADVNEIRIQYVLDTSDLKTAKQQFDGLTQAEKKAEDEAEKLREELKKTGKEGADSAKKAKEGFGDLNDLLKKGGGLIAGYFAADQLISFGKQVVEITGKFQRYAAVLKNSLGTGSAAEAAMSMIKKFAAETPFSVDELTDSFVRLSNGGFKPTQNQMRQLGDLASSTGKSFNQLSEAILDAQTGEFERLKEFGIIARKSGENVTFTFKGVETQTKMTSKAIQEYVLSLGDAVGVSGAMTAISKTLEGQTSNLGDTWDALLLIIGDGVAPLYSKVLGVTSEFLADLQLLFRSSQDDQRENNSDMYQGMVDDAMKYDKELLEESMRAKALYLE
jgi:phage tail tape-measure protein